MSETFPSLVSTDWLAGRLGMPGLVVLDATRHLPAAKRDAKAEFEAAHIPGARFLDLETLTDATSPVPAALPSSAQLADRLAGLGVRANDTIVVYDDSAVKTAARAWFTLKLHGMERVAILDGGLGQWRDEGRPLESGFPTIKPAEPIALTQSDAVRFKDDMLANLASRAEQVLDARGADRVFGTGIDPVHGGQNGRIPGSLNLPYSLLYQEDGRFKSLDELRSLLSEAGVDPDRPVVTTCGSGVTACILIFAMHLVGKRDTALYDGSWSEWEADPDTPKAQGPA